jgi:pimeloyl-ACP methyl ester carboxylesterase
MRRLGVLSVLVAAVTIASMCSAVTGASASTSVGEASAPVHLGKSSIKWHSCPKASGLKGYPGAECAMLKVPLNYSKPKGTKIELAISRVKHTVSSSKFQGVILVNPGGPGGSGLSLSSLGSAVPNGVGGYYDWIGFDPRGVGSSVPALTCDNNYFNFDRPNYDPTTSADLKVWEARSKAYAKDCAKDNAPLLANMTTIDNAKDMDSIRKALGATQISYYGFSYGTYLGQVYSTLYPSRVRREVLDSNVDPRNVWYAANLSQDLAFNRNIKIWFGWLAKYDSTYHLGSTEAAVEALFYKTRAKLAVHPAGGKIGPDEWTDAFVFAAYYQSTWLDEASVFSKYINKDDVTDLENEYANDEGMGNDNGFAVYNATECTDVKYPTNIPATLKQNAKYNAKAPFLTWDNYWYNGPCLYWPSPAHASTPFKVNGSKIASALLIDETLDAATPYEGSLYVRSLFPHSSLIALPGGTSHANSLFGDACEDDQIAAYLKNGTRPARKSGPGPDATCAPLPQPVPSATSAVQAEPNLSAGFQFLAGSRN